MEKKYRKTKKGELYPPIPRKPLPEGTEESENSLYHIAVMILVGALLCLVIGAIDHFSLDSNPTTDTTNTIEYFE